MSVRINKTKKPKKRFKIKNFLKVCFLSTVWLLTIIGIVFVSILSILYYPIHLIHKWAFKRNKTK